MPKETQQNGINEQRLICTEAFRGYMVRVSTLRPEHQSTWLRDLAKLTRYMDDRLKLLIDHEPAVLADGIVPIDGKVNP